MTWDPTLRGGRACPMSPAPQRGCSPFVRTLETTGWGRAEGCCITHLFIAQNRHRLGPWYLGVQCFLEKVCAPASSFIHPTFTPPPPHLGALWFCGGGHVSSWTSAFASLCMYRRQCETILTKLDSDWCLEKAKRWGRPGSHTHTRLLSSLPVWES